MQATKTIQAVEYITDAVMSERIVKGDYHWGYRMSCADCGHSDDIGRHETVFDKDIPLMYAAKHQHCGDVL